MSNQEQREKLVSRALALPWTMAKICRTMGLAGGGTDALARFKKGSSRDLEAKYKLLLKAVEAAGGGAVPVGDGMKTASKKPLPAKDALQSDSDDDSSADDDVESCYHTRLTEKKQREIKTAYGPYEKYGDCEKLEVACVKAIRSLHPHGKKSDSTHFAHKVAVRLIQEVLRDKRSPRISLQVIFGMVDILSDGAVGSIVAKNHNKVDSLVELLWRRCIEGRFDIHSHDAALAIAEYVKNNKKALKACNIRNGAEFKAWAEKHMDEGIDVLRKMRDGDVCPEARGLSAFSRDAARLLLRAQRSTKALVGL